MQRKLTIIIFLIILLIVLPGGYIFYHRTFKFPCRWNTSIKTYFIGDSLEQDNQIGFEINDGCKIFFKKGYVIGQGSERRTVSKSEFFNKINEINKNCSNCVKNETSFVD